MVCHHIQYLLYAFALFNLSSCSHQSAINPSSAHINESKIPSKLELADRPVINNENLVVKNKDLSVISAQTKEPVYNIVVYDTPVKEVLFAMARDSKMNVDIHPAVQGRITLNAVDQTLPAILARISKQVDLSYKIENDVLLISPDQPELRTYKIDYVNMSRDTTGFIGAAAEISSTGQSATTGVGGNSTIVNTSGNGANNSSRTAVNSESKNKFWETMEKNIKDILAETDKEIVITRLANPKLNKKSTLSQTSPSNSIENVAVQDVSARLQEEYTEFKTLYAATVIVNREAGVINVRATNKQHVRVEDFIQQVEFTAADA